ncbi:MAG: hypothetical protein EBU90_23850, partial [Proteobacteria bacterium]|nr:hypothetical protein [Pseudomonadota bacterium]
IIEDNYQTYIKDGMVIELLDDPRTHKQLLTLSSWAPSSIIKQNECVIGDNDILTKFEPTDQFLEYYIGTLKAITNMAKAKEETDKLEDEEIISLIEAMEEKEHYTLQ